MRLLAERVIAGVCSSLVAVLLLVACIVVFVLHSLYYVQRFLDGGASSRERVKRCVCERERDHGSYDKILDTA